MDKSTPRDAAIAAFKTLEINPVDQLGLITMVSEHGYESEDPENLFFDTVSLLEASDQLGYYKTDDWFD
jgi:hypothetical protein